MTHILMISTDTTLATQPQGASRERHRVYAERFAQHTPDAHLTVIVPSKTATEKIPVSEHFTIIAQQGVHKALFPWDAVRIAKREHHLRPFTLVIAQDPFLTGIAGVLLRRVLQVPLLVQNHSVFFNNPAFIAEHPLRNRVLITLAERVVKMADFYRTVNHHQRAIYIQQGGEPERASVLPLGTAAPEFAQPASLETLRDVRHQLGLTDDEHILLWVGHDYVTKRHHLLIDILANVVKLHPKTRLLMVGNLSKIQAQLTQRAVGLGVEKQITFVGGVPFQQLPLYYQMSDVYIHTSSYEGAPRVFFEASASGLPTVAFAVPGMQECIQVGVNGYLATDGDLDGFASHISTLLQNADLRERLGKQAQEIAFREYAADGYANRWVALWLQAIELGKRA